MEKTRRRKNIRIVLGILAVIPIVLLVYNLFFLTDYGGDSIEEMAFMIFGVPILVFNFWAWSYPELIEFFLWGNQDDR